MFATALVLAALAGLLHVYIWVLESWRWESPSTQRVFGVSAEDAATTKDLAYNQGYYNLFLAVIAFAGIAVGVWGGDQHRDAGIALLCAGVGSMLAAALVLATRDRSKIRAALIQGSIPALCLVALALAW